MMKKFFLLLTTLAMMAMMVGCNKYCTCKKPGSTVPTSVEVGYDDSCGDLSSEDYGDCV